MINYLALIPTRNTSWLLQLSQSRDHTEKRMKTEGYVTYFSRIHPLCLLSPLTMQLRSTENTTITKMQSFLAVIA